MELEEAEEEGEREHTATRFWEGIFKNKHIQITRFHPAEDLVNLRQTTQPAHF